jgi:hypothetical protein
MILNKAFLSKTGCLKIQYNEQNKSIYLHIGKKTQDQEWKWIKTKLGSEEAGDIINVILNRQQSISFYHSFNGKQTRIWINKDEKGLLWIRIEDYRKQLSTGEQMVFKILLDKAILESNLEVER